MADMELGVAIRPEMVFAVGSTIKPFTAIGIMILVQRGIESEFMLAADSLKLFAPPARARS